MAGTPDAAQPPAPRPRRHHVVVIAGVMGLALLVYVIADLGVARIADDVRRLGTVLPAVLALSGAKFVLQTCGWRLVLRPASRPPWTASLSATVSGDALGYLTWAGQLTGEPMRALLIRDSVPLADGIAAGAVERAAYNVAAALLVWAVLLGLLLAGHPVWLSAALVVSGVLAGRGARALRRALEPRSSAELPGRPALDVPAGSRSRWHRRLASVAAGARTLWQDRRRALPALIALAFAQHGLLVCEAYLMLGALGGAPPLSTALVFEAVTKVVNTAGAFVPARLGVSEAGSAAIAGALGFAASHGLSLALMRRARSLIWAVVGLALVPRQEARVQAAARH